MKMKHIASLFLLSVFTTAAFAGPKPKELYSDGDWILWDTDKNNPDANCVMRTTSDAGANYSLQFVHSKRLPGPTELQIQVDGKVGASSYTMTLKDETVLAFANLGESVPKKQSFLWNIPQHTDRLIADLENRKDLRLKPADGTRDQRIEFSADGFKRVKDKMIEKCLGGKPLYDQEFEELFAIKRDAINPLGITPEQTKELRKILNAGYSIHLGINGTRDDLIKLTQKFQAQLNEKQSLIARIDDMGNVQIPSIMNSQQNNDALEAQSRARLQQVNITISQQQSTLAAAQAQLTTARNVIAPYEAEHSDRYSRASSTRAAVNAGAQRLSEIDNGIRNAEVRVNQLSNEAGSLQNENARLDRDVRYARQNLMTAQRDAQIFRPRQEEEERLRRNPGYQNSLRELAKIQNQLQIIRNGLNDAKGKLLARQTELRVCQTRTSFIEKSSVERIPAQVNPDRRPRPDGDRTPRPDGDRPDRRPRPDGDNTPSQPAPTPTPAPTQPAPAPTTPAEPTPTTPAVDCTVQQNAVTAAQQVVSNLEAQERNEQAKFQDVNRDVQRIENRTREEVNNIEMELRQRVRQAEQQVAGLENQISNNIRRVDVISNVEIPQQQNIINSLSAERPSVQARYDQDAPNANRLEAELASFERRVGWDAKVQAVENAENLVAQRSSELNRSQSEKSSLENQINRCISERSRLANLLVDTQNRKAAAEQRLTVVIQSLVPYDQEKARLEQSQSDLRNQLATMAQEFESKLP